MQVTDEKDSTTRNLFNALTFVISLCTVFLIIECGFRVKAYYDDKDILSKSTLSKFKVPEGIGGKSIPFGYKIMMSENEKIVYQLKPNLVLTDIKTNSDGFRDEEYNIEKDENTIRIIGIGDSFMFGNNVPMQKNYLSFLEKSLNERFPDKKMGSHKHSSPRLQHNNGSGNVES